ncbi:MAG: class II fructose-bisphosphate aldolase [Planctomycetaceae bacterium]|nr:class II fructose-bisphosphate aldolase [Planctomycetaceae bacterium]
MLLDLTKILDIAEAKRFAVPAFNVYNMETVMGIVQAAEEANSPVIMQTYSRLFASGTAFYVAPIVLAAAHAAKVPVCYHLDHGAGHTEIARALRCGCTGIMCDWSSLPLEQNIAETRRTVELCKHTGVSVEGELGYVGTTKDEITTEYTDVDEAVRFIRETGVAALAIQVGTAHGRYKKSPQVAVDRIAAILAEAEKAGVNVPLVLHGGSGIPDEQVRAAIDAGIRKVNFGTDICFAFLDRIFETSREVYAIDLFMKGAVQAVKEFALEKIHLLHAEDKA